jgi:hypothetical protein
MGMGKGKPKPHNKSVSFGVVCGITAMLGLSCQPKLVSLSQHQTLGLSITQTADSLDRSVYILR